MADTTNKYNFLDYEGLSLFWNNVKKVIEDNELVTLYKDGNIYYYLEKEIEEDLIYWGDSKIYDNI